jgi:hypothetical protein
VHAGLTLLRLGEISVVKPVGFGVSPDLIVRGHVVHDSGGLDARGVIAQTVALDRGDPRLVQGDPLLHLDQNC